MSELKIWFQVLPYDQLMQELDVTNVRELEDFLINECMYSVGIHDVGSYIPMQSISLAPCKDYTHATSEMNILTIGC